MRVVFEVHGDGNNNYNYDISLCYRNLKESVTEEALREIFEAHGKIEKVKKMKDYAFVHFEERKHATK